LTPVSSHRAHAELVPRHDLGTAEGPATERRAAGAVRALDDAVECNELTDDDLAHGCLLGIYAGETNGHGRRGQPLKVT
jgi:hypothetical protein